MFQGFESSRIKFCRFKTVRLHAINVKNAVEGEIAFGKVDSRANVTRTYRQLLVWKKAKHLAILCYRITEDFPKAELFGLTSQIRRAAVSVASNIAEGQGRLTRGEFRHFLGQARGSLLELETQAAIAFELEYMRPDAYESLESCTLGVLGLLNRLIQSLAPQTAAPKP